MNTETQIELCTSLQRQLDKCVEECYDLLVYAYRYFLEHDLGEIPESIRDLIEWEGKRVSSRV